MKRFLLKSILYSLPVIIPIVIFCSLINPYISGDIGSLGYITFPKCYAEGITVTKQVVNCGYKFADYQENDILTIGDSFSQTNHSEISYNNYLAEYSGRKIFNLSQDRWSNPFNRFIYLSKTQNIPKIVIVECVERVLIERLNSLTINQSPNDMILYKVVDTTTCESTSIRKSILERTQEWTKRKIQLPGYENPIYHAKLSTPLFSCQEKESDLYFYSDDILRMDTNAIEVKSALEKLDSLFNYAASINVDLYVLIAADKYDVYQDYIVDNKYPQQLLLENITSIYSHSHLINSKDTLSQMVAAGVLDVYWANNTHWSPIGSKAVAEYITNITNKEKNRR